VVNRARVLKAADKYVRQGKLEAAVKEFLKLVQDNPRDVATINRVGDLYSKLGKKEQAIQQFSRIAEFYTDEGFLLKAIAIYKKITKLEPSSLEAYRCLADLYSQQGLTMEARAQYQFVADQCLKAGRDEEALESLREIERLHPHDLKVRLGLAELLGRLGHQDQALATYRAVGTELDRKGMHQESRRVYEAALALAPGECGLVRRLVGVLTRQGEATRAIELVSGLLKERPEDPELLSLLGDAHLDNAAVEEAREIYERVRQLAPERIENRLNEVHLALKEGDLDAAYLQLEEAMEQVPGPETSRRVIPYVLELLDAQPHHLGALASLARMHEGAGEEGPCRDAYIRLAGASLEQEDLESASSALRHLIRLEPDNPRHRERFDEVMERVRESGGETSIEDLPEPPAEASERLAQPAPPTIGESPAGAVTVQPGEPVVADMLPEAAEEPLDQDFIAEHMTEAEVFVKYGLVDKALQQLRMVSDRYPQLLSAREALLEIYREEGQREEAVGECRAIAAILQDMGDAEGARKTLEQAEQILPGSVAGPAPAEVEEAPAEEPEAAGEEGAEEEVVLEEEYQAEEGEEPIELDPAPDEVALSMERLQAVDALLERGSVEEARRDLLALRAEFPGRSEIEERLARATLIEEAAATEAAPQESRVETAKEGGGNFFDLAAELDPELFQPQSAVEDAPDDLAEGHTMKDLVAAFKQGVEAQVDAEDFETHYNLAIAYKEMGLIDEAIGEFQFASRSAEFLTRCCSMLGICFREKGMNELAIQWYHRGLEVGGAGNDEGVLGLRYDLAALYEDSGEAERALELFTEVYGVNATYRDVPDRIRLLKDQVEGS
jgi:tetratricopeptide (TPR) repeat protein